MENKYMRYTFKDFITGKERWTRGKFAGWTEPTKTQPNELKET